VYFVPGLGAATQQVTQVFWRFHNVYSPIRLGTSGITVFIQLEEFN
jgi:hypothetical protein